VAFLFVGLVLKDNKRIDLTGSKTQKICIKSINILFFGKKFFKDENW